MEKEENTLAFKKKGPGGEKGQLEEEIKREKRLKPRWGKKGQQKKRISTTSPKKERGPARSLPFGRQ